MCSSCLCSVELETYKEINFILYFVRNMEVQLKNMSWLRARDPSILAWNHHLSDVRINLNNTELLESTSDSASNKDTAHDNLLKVYLRIKTTENFKELYEIVDNNKLLCKVPEGAQCIRNVRDGNIITKTFSFSKIFGSQSKQTDLFNGVVKEKVVHFINGYNCSLLTYGASGSGKTFTIVGTPDEPGIIPRALEYLFRTLPQLPDQSLVKPTASGGVIRLTESTCEAERFSRQNLLKGTNTNIDRALHTRTYKAMQQQLSQEPVALLLDDISDVSLGVWVSFAEIYNEYVYDLLAPEAPRGRPKQKLRLGYSNGKAYIKDLTCVSVSSGLQAYHILQYGLHNLKYAPTSINDHSSRSHSIFTIKLVQASNTEEGGSVSLINFCDLAGSERVKKTNNAGERLKESNNINTSLLVLGRCVSLVRESQKHNDNRLIPFRESKLTQLFQKALLGQEAISMIVNINPTREMFDESQHVLNFSAIAKDVIIEQPHLVKHLKNNRFSQYIEKGNAGIHSTIEESEIEELQEQVELLYNELQQQKLDSEEDKQHIIRTYKQLLVETQKYWEDRCKELEDRYIKGTQTNEESGQQQSKRRKMSIITIDSSSEDEDKDDVQKDGNTSKDSSTAYEEQQSDQKNDLIHLQSQLAESKLQLQSQHEKIMQLTAKNNSLKETLEDAKTAYLDLQSRFENDSKQLNLEHIRQQEKINDLNMYLSAFHKAKDAECYTAENKENSDPFFHNNDSCNTS